MDAFLLHAVTVAAPVKIWVAAAIVALTPLVISILGWVYETYVAALPAYVKAIAATILGGALAYLTALQTQDIVLAAIVGMACIGLRDWISKLGRAGLFGSRAKAFLSR